MMLRMVVCLEVWWWWCVCGDMGIGVCDWWWCMDLDSWCDGCCGGWGCVWCLGWMEGKWESGRGTDDAGGDGDEGTRGKTRKMVMGVREGVMGDGRWRECWDCGGCVWWCWCGCLGCLCISARRGLIRCTGEDGSIRSSDWCCVNWWVWWWWSWWIIYCYWGFYWWIWWIFWVYCWKSLRLEWFRFATTASKLFARSRWWISRCMLIIMDMIW